MIAQNGCAGTMPDHILHWEKLFGWRFHVIPQITFEGRVYGPLYPCIGPITPCVAEILLEQYNGGNRPLHPGNVKMIELALKAREWMLTGQPIILSTAKKLQDGQHRLYGIRKSGVPAVALIVAGVDPDAFKYTDLGDKRGLNDMLTVSQVAESRGVSQAVPFLQVFLARGCLSTSGRSPDEKLMGNQLRFAMQHPGLISSTECVRGFGDGSRILRSRGLAVALHYILTRTNPDLAAEFLEPLLSWRIPPEDRFNPIGTLFTQLSNMVRRDIRKPEDVGVWVIRAWNSFVQGKTTTRLQLSKREEYPKIEGLSYEGRKPILPHVGV